LSKSSISDRNTEDFNSESLRLVVSDLLNGIESPFDSTINIKTDATYGMELQQIQGSSPNGTSRLVYPKNDFSTWQPIINITNNINYTSSATSSVTLSIINNRSSLTTDSVTYNDYRWYVRKFETSGGISTVQGNGTFVFNTDFTESDLSTQNNGSPGSGNLQLFLGLSNNVVPVKWYDMTRLFSSGGGVRSNATGAGSNNLDSNGKISWNTEFLNGWTSYLLIGIRNTSTSNEISQIDIVDGNWN